MKAREPFSCLVWTAVIIKPQEAESKEEFTSGAKWEYIKRPDLRTQYFRDIYRILISSDEPSSEWAWYCRTEQDYGLWLSIFNTII